MNWSGRGQHAEFDLTEEDLIPLIHEKVLGYSATALVDSVRCRRIRLARKYNFSEIYYKSLPVQRLQRTTMTVNLLRHLGIMK